MSFAFPVYFLLLLKFLSIFFCFDTCCFHKYTWTCIKPACFSLPLLNHDELRAFVQNVEFFIYRLGHDFRLPTLATANWKSANFECNRYNLCRLFYNTKIFLRPVSMMYNSSLRTTFNIANAGLVSFSLDRRSANDIMRNFLRKKLSALQLRSYG